VKNDDLALTNNIDIERIELEGFTRSVAEIEWLQLILVLLYYVSPGVEFKYPFGVFISIVLFATFVISFHYVNFFTIPSKWKIAIETWVMILFVSMVIISTGEIDSPLLSLYVLTIIACALSLGKLITFLEIGLIAAVYVYICFPVYASNGVTLIDFTKFMTAFVPVLLIAYVTTMLAADVQHGKKILKLLSETDDMTGFKNKRSVHVFLETEFKKAVRYARGFSIMMLDADNLKDINDQLGHAAGDRLIKMMASIIRDNLRASDIISRYGGDEFLVLMPETGPRNAKEAAEKVRLAIQNAAFDVDGHRVSTTVSVGIAGFPDDSNTKEALLDCADRALYESKKAGRNRITLYAELVANAA
jgi:diguanylate cyclase (GGDEF)-like protein